MSFLHTTAQIFDFRCLSHSQKTNMIVCCMIPSKGKKNITLATMVPELISEETHTRDENSMENLYESHKPLTSIIKDDEGRAVTPIQEITPRVRFAMDQPNSKKDPGAPPLFSFLTPEMCTDLWYQPSNLCKFKTDIRCLLKRKNPDTDVELSDLGRYGQDRVMIKKRANFLVLAAHKEQKGPNFLSIISQKCSAWTCGMARYQGYINFCQTCNVVVPYYFGNTDNCNDEFFNHCMKRKQEALSRAYEERRVRPRT